MAGRRVFDVLRGTLPNGPGLGVQLRGVSILVKAQADGEPGGVLVLWR